MSLGEVLDIGTGSALIPIELCRQSSEVHVVAVDLSPSMLDVATININLAELNDRIMIDLVDAKELQFDSGRFDSVISNSIVHHIPDPSVVLKEAVRVTKPGGLLFFRDLMRPDSIETVQHLVDTYTGSENEHAQQMFYNSLKAALNLQEIQLLVQDLGFTSDSVQATSDRHWTWSAIKPDKTSKTI